MTTSLPQAARIVSVCDESAKVRSYTLDLRLEADPGQFVMAWLPGIDEKPFSLAQPVPVMLTIARAGPFSGALHALRAGDRLWVRGPLGRPFTLPRPAKAGGPGRLLMVAGGYGVAPLYFLARRAVASAWPVTAVIGARTAADVIFRDRFLALGARAVTTTDDGSLGEPCLATEAAARLVDDGSYAAVYACGPEAMLLEVERLARDLHLPAQLSYERYMRCALGVCGSCVRKGWLVCRDGPVLKIEP